MNSLQHPGLFPLSEHLSRRKFASNPTCCCLLKQVKGKTVSKQQWIRQAQLLSRLRQHTACSAQSSQESKQQDAPQSYKENELDDGADNDANAVYDSGEDADDPQDQPRSASWFNIPEDETAPGRRRARLSGAASIRSNGSSNGSPESSPAQTSTGKSKPSLSATTSRLQATSLKNMAKRARSSSPASTATATADEAPSTAASQAATTSSSSTLEDVEAARDQADSSDEEDSPAQDQQERLQSANSAETSTNAGQSGDRDPGDRRSINWELMPSSFANRMQETRRESRPSIIGRSKKEGALPKDYMSLKLLFQPSVSRWSEFDEAARATTFRLRPAVDMEDVEGKASVQLLYSKSKTNELARNGVILLGLQARRLHSFYSDVMWAFSLPPPVVEEPSDDDTKGLKPRAAGEKGSLLSARARTATSPPGAMGDGTQQKGVGRSKQMPAPPQPDLPFNRFKPKETVMIVDMKKRRFVHSQGETQGGLLSGTIAEVRKSHLKVVLERSDSDQLEDFVDLCNDPLFPDPARFRIDKQEQETTSQRQITVLDHLGVSQVLKHHLTGRTLDRDELRGRFLSELNIKQVLFGCAPSVQESAESPPSWATTEGRGSWKSCIGGDIQLIDDLNQSQRVAVAKAVLRRFTLWQGPPGTGKTRTLLAYIRAMVEHSGGYLPILACADTNAAVDNLVEGLTGYFSAPLLDPMGRPVLDAKGKPTRKAARSINVVRLGQPAKVSAKAQHRTLDALAEQHELAQEAQAKRQEAANLIEKVSKGVPWEKLDREVKRALRAKTSTLELEAKELIDKAKVEVVNTAEVIAATCTGAGDERTLQGKVFRVVVIDEATQATEPSTLIPLMRGAESVVMAGDPQQLPPTVVSMAASEMGLQVTLFDRLQEAGVAPLLLDQQYRMHPLIAHIPSLLFYEGRLRTGTSAAERLQPEGFPWPNPTCPVTLIPCDYGREQTGQSSRTTAVAEAQAVVGDDGASYKNEEEAALVMRALEVLLDYGHLGQDADCASVALLTPYNGQYRELQRRFHSIKRLSQYADKVVISSIDGFQGKEATVVILSTVRCNSKQKLGFVNDYRRMNVAISRPKRGLIVVGSPSTLQANDNWREWLQWVLSYRSILDPSALDVSHYPPFGVDDDSDEEENQANKGRSAARGLKRTTARQAMKTGERPEEKVQLAKRQQQASAGAEARGQRLLRRTPRPVA